MFKQNNIGHNLNKSKLASNCYFVTDSLVIDTVLLQTDTLGQLEPVMSTYT